MSASSEFEYLPRIPATEESAQALQALTLQDVLAGGFENPTALADPDDPRKVATQLERLEQFPERYSGYRQENGLIVAYMKAAEWLVGDEVPFVDNTFAREAFKLSSRLRGGSLRPKAYGVFGLVSDEALSDEIRRDMHAELLTQSIGRATVESARVVNIVLHDADPVRPVADELGFEPVGPRREAAGAPGLEQQRFQRQL